MRIFLSLLLPLCSGEGFLAFYLFCGISDILDGAIARRYNLETALGAKLDSVGDAVFWAVVAGLVLVRTNIITTKIAVAFFVILLLRLLNLTITRSKFKEWGMLHSWGNKASGLLLYLLLPLCIVTDSAPLPVLIVIFTATLCSALDETAVLLTTKEYCINRKSYFISE